MNNFLYKIHTFHLPDFVFILIQPFLSLLTYSSRLFTHFPIAVASVDFPSVSMHFKFCFPYMYFGFRFLFHCIHCLFAVGYLLDCASGRIHLYLFVRGLCWETDKSAVRCLDRPGNTILGWEGGTEGMCNISGSDCQLLSAPE